VFAAIGLAVWHSCEFSGYNPTKLLIFWAIFLVEFGLTALFVVFEWNSKKNVQSDFDRRLATLIAASVSLPLLIILRANNLGGSLRLVKSERVWSSPAGRVWLAKEAFQTIVLCPLAYVGYPFGILSVTAFPFAAEMLFASVTAGPRGVKQKPTIRLSCAILLVQALYFGMPIISLLTDYGMFSFYGEGICGGATYTPNQNLYNPYSLTVGLILCKMWVEVNLCFILHGWNYSAVYMYEAMEEAMGGTDMVPCAKCIIASLSCIVEALRFATGLVYIVLWFLGVFLWVAIGMAQCQSERLLLIPAILSWVCWFLSLCVAFFRLEGASFFCEPPSKGGCLLENVGLRGWLKDIFCHILGAEVEGAEAEVEKVMVWMGMIVCTHVEPQADTPPPQAPVDGKYRSSEVFAVGDSVRCRDKGKDWRSGVVTAIDPLKVQQKGFTTDSGGFLWDEVEPEDSSFQVGEVKEVEEHVDEHVECGLPPGWRQKQVCMTPWRLFRARFA
jgi:hypothetical protein